MIERHSCVWVGVEVGIAPPLGSFWGGLRHRWNLTSGYVHLRNSFEILILGPQLCPGIWAYTVIGLLKKHCHFASQVEGKFEMHFK